MTDQPPQQWRPETRFYRRRPGLGWFAALLVVPLLLASIGWDGSTRDEPSAEPTPSTVASAPVNPGPPSIASSTSRATPTPNASGAPFGPFSLRRTPNGFALGGKMSDEVQRSALLEAIGMGMPGAVVSQELGVDTNVRTPDIALLGGMFSVIGNVPDFALRLDRGTLTLTGTAPTEKDRATIESAAAEAWPGVPIVNDLRAK